MYCNLCAGFKKKYNKVNCKSGHNPFNDKDDSNGRQITLVGGSSVLVLTDIYYSGRKVKHYRHSLSLTKSLVITSDNCVSLDIRDTGTGKFRNVPLKDVLTFEGMFDIFGVIKTPEEIVFISVDIETWLLLDCVDKINVLGVVQCKEDLLKHTYQDLKYIERKVISSCPIVKYSCNCGVVYTFKLNYSISQVDKLGVFWEYNGSLYNTFYYFYLLLSLVENKDCIAFYVSGRNDFTLKLDLNKDINRLLTKFAVMKDKVHW